MSVHIAVDRGQIESFCRRWKIAEFAFFGSVLTEDFRPESDVDVLVSFWEDADWTLFDLVRMQEELSRILGRRVDLLDRRSVEASRNYIRRRHILNSLETLYVA